MPTSKMVEKRPQQTSIIQCSNRNLKVRNWKWKIFWKLKKIPFNEEWNVELDGDNTCL